MIERSSTALVRAACLAVVAAAGCSDARAPRPMPDGGDPSHTPERIVSLLPAATQILQDLGAGDRLVGVASDGLPAADLPRVGNPLSPDLEAISRLDPDLVVAWSDSDVESLRRAMTEHGRLLPLRIQTIEDLRAAIGELGRELGLEDRATAALARLARDLDEAERLGARATAPRVAWVVWHDPPTLAGPGTHLDDLLRAVGATNVLEAGEGPWPVVSFEALVTRDPDVVVWPEGVGLPDPSEAGAGWAALGAFRRDAVVRVPGAEYQVPGPSIGASAIELARSLDAATGDTR